MYTVLMLSVLAPAGDAYSPRTGYDQSFYPGSRAGGCAQSYRAPLVPVRRFYLDFEERQRVVTERVPVTRSYWDWVPAQEDYAPPPAQYSAPAYAAEDYSAFAYDFAPRSYSSFAFRDSFAFAPRDFAFRSSFEFAPRFRGYSSFSFRDSFAFRDS